MESTTSINCTIYKICQPFLGKYNWSLLTEDQMREKLLTPTSQIHGRRPRRKCVSDGTDFGDIEICGTPDLNHYYETGELPKNEAERELFLKMIEKGGI